MKTDEEMENMKKRWKDQTITLTKYVIYLFGIPEKNGRTEKIGKNKYSK